MAGDAFQKFKTSFNRGVATISVKTSSSLEKVKIKTHIESIEKEIEHLLSEIGENAYEIWEKNDMNYSVLAEKCSFVKQKKDEIIQLNEAYNSIDERDGQILGTSSNEENHEVKEEVTITNDSITCPNCGSTYIQSVKFCKKCGQKLKD